LTDELLQRRALNVLHDKKILTRLFDEIIDGNSVRMSKRGSSTSLAAKTFDGAKITLIQGAQHFNCHKPLDAVIPRFEDARHTTCGDMFKNLVPSSNSCAFKLVQRFTSTTWVGKCTTRTYSIRG